MKSLRETLTGIADHPIPVPVVWMSQERFQDLLMIPLQAYQQIRDLGSHHWADKDLVTGEALHLHLFDLIM